MEALCKTLINPTTAMTVPSPLKAAGSNWSNSGMHTQMQAKIHPLISSMLRWVMPMRRQVSRSSFACSALAMRGWSRRVNDRYGTCATAAMKAAIV